ncbi:MAG: hypothetical protein WAM95_17035, partial [Bacillus sp. (in: firmicutes)]
FLLLSFYKALFSNNESFIDDKCLEEKVKDKRITDDEARIFIMKNLDKVGIPEVKSLPKEERNVILRKVAKILGITLPLIFRA